MEHIEKIIRISNTYYNQGLERAKVRDLSGAAESLRRSLKFYKLNTPARNLLGLVYFEMGETVDAISQWVISKSLMPEHNIAESYLEAVQSNANKLEALNQTIKKYNQVLLYCKQGNKDLAVIQLKKVLMLNPKFVKGHQLLALLYMEAGRPDLAKRALRNASKIDTNNTITLHYFQEVNKQLRGESSGKKQQKVEKEKPVAYQRGNDTIIRPEYFKDTSALGTILNIIVGVVIGVLITWFLIVPNIKQTAISDANKSVREANEIISTKNQNIKKLEEQLGELQLQVDEAKKNESDSQNVIAVYDQLLMAYDAFMREEVEAAAIALENVDAAMLTGAAGQIYQNMSQQITEQYIGILYQQGKFAYDRQMYQEAVEKLQKVIDTDENYEEGYALYYLANAYRKLEQKEQALTYYQKVIELMPGTERARTAQAYIDEQQANTEQ